MTETSEDIRRQIEETRADLDQRLGQLTAKAEHVADVRDRLSERPWVTLATAVVTGFMLGRAGRRPEAPKAAAASSNGGAPRLASLRPHLEVLVSAATVALAGVVRDAVLHEMRAWKRVSRMRARERRRERPATRAAEDGQPSA